MGCITQKPSNTFNFVTAQKMQGVTLDQINDDLDYCTLNPPSPQNLIVTDVGFNYINLEWTSFSSGIDTGFEVYRSLTGVNGSWVKIATLLTDVTTYEDTGLGLQITYYYKVRAIGIIPSDYTNIVSAKTVYEFIFQTNHAASGSFDPQITYTGADTPKWVFANGYEVTGVSPVVNLAAAGLNGTTQDVKLVLLETDMITSLNFGQDSIVGVFDLTGFAGSTMTSIIANNNAITSLLCTGINFASGFTFQAQNNPVLNNLTFDSDQSVVASVINFGSTQIGSFDRGDFIFTATKLTLNSCLLTGFNLKVSDTFNILNLSSNSISSLSNLSSIDIVGSAATFNLSNNTSLNPSFASSFSGSLRFFNISNTSKSGSLNLSGYTWSGGEDIQFGGTNITGVTPPVGVTSCSRYYGNDNASWTQTTLNLSAIASNTNGTQFDFSNTPSITTVTPPTVGSKVVTMFDFTGCVISNFGDWTSFTFKGTSSIRVSLAFNTSVTSFLMGTQTAAYRYILFNDTGIKNYSAIIPKLLPQPILGLTAGSGYIDLSNCAMSSGEVDAVLNLMATQFNVVASEPITIYLTGTNAAPSGLGSAYAAILNSRGYTVLTV